MADTFGRGGRKRRNGQDVKFEKQMVNTYVGSTVSNLTTGGICSNTVEHTEEMKLHSSERNIDLWRDSGI